MLYVYTASTNNNQHDCQIYPRNQLLNEQLYC